MKAMPDIFVAKKKIGPGLGELKQKTSSIWAAFISQPKNLRFETQEKKEKIVLLLRRHPITNIPWIFLTLLVFLVPFFILNNFSLKIIPGNFRFISLLCWYLLVFAFAFEKTLIWFFNVYILTDERLIDINFPTLLYRSISQTKIDKIQNVSVKTSGYVRSLFNFGDVQVQSAEAIPQIVFEAVPNPEWVSQIINDLILEEEQEKIDGRIR